MAWSGSSGSPHAIGEDFHITSDEALSWNQIYQAVGAAAGVEPDLLHVPTDALVADDPGLEGTLVGDKIHSTVFDMAKLRAIVPEFAARVPIAEGISRTVAWFDAEPSRRAVDDTANSFWDRLAEVYVGALAQAAGLRSVSER